jgi:Fe-coproporphyrin III synthase
MEPTAQVRVAHIHPTRQCNQRCLHCYASSSPQVTESLNFELIKNAITDLAEENYNWVSFTGGEPTAYVPLPVLLRHAKRHALKTQLVTNGIMLNPRRLDELAPMTDLMLLGLDGIPESHNRLRGSAKAFELMASRLPLIRERQITFGFSFTLTQQNLRELQWVVEYALSVGASVLQIHSLEGIGAAAANLPSSVPDDLQGAFAYLLVQDLQKRVGGRLELQLELLHSDVLKEHPQLFCAKVGAMDPKRPLSEILSSLVIEADGTVVAMKYGFPRRFALGNLHHTTLSTLCSVWRREGCHQFEAICAQAFRQAIQLDSKVTHWNGLLAQVARDFPTTLEAERAAA